MTFLPAAPTTTPICGVQGYSLELNGVVDIRTVLRPLQWHLPDRIDLPHPGNSKLQALILMVTINNPSTHPYQTANINLGKPRTAAKAFDLLNPPSTAGTRNQTRKHSCWATTRYQTVIVVLQMLLALDPRRIRTLSGSTMRNTKTMLLITGGWHMIYTVGNVS